MPMRETECLEITYECEHRIQEQHPQACLDSQYNSGWLYGLSNCGYLNSVFYTIPICSEPKHLLISALAMPLIRQLQCYENEISKDLQVHG